MTAEFLEIPVNGPIISYPIPAFVVIGLDEVGRGPLAGPVTAAGAVLRPGYKNDQIIASKQLSHQKRLELVSEVVANSLVTSVVSVGPRRIEALNIREASRVAMLLCVQRIWRSLARELQKQRAESSGQFNTPNYQLLIDGNVPLATTLPQETIIKGDAKIRCIAAASILAKVTRDSLMDELDRRFPGYNLAKNKGYPTKDHFSALEQLGPSRIHRRTFRGVRELLSVSSPVSPSIDSEARRGSSKSVSSSARVSGAQAELAFSTRRT